MSDQNPPERSRRLGRGLGALIGGAQANTPSNSATTPAPTDRLRDIPTSQIRTNPFQPRREFDDDELRELEDSLRTNGLLQPITVRQNGTDFELIAGERRLRAARRLGWTTIPAIVRETSEQQLLALALVENLQREDLNPIDEAEGYQRLAREFGLTQQQIAETVGKDRSTVANMLRLLGLPDDVQHFVRTGQLSVGHARALLGLPSEVPASEVAHEILRRQMTVRDVERLAQQHKPDAQKKRSRASASAADAAELRHITDRLRRYLQTDVSVVANEKAQGELRIRFYSADDLERLLELIVGPPDEGV